MTDIFKSSGAWWRAGRSQPGPSHRLGLAAPPRPSPTGTRCPGRGQGGLEFVIPGRVCGRNAGPGIGGKGGGSRRESERSRRGPSGTRPKKKSRQDSAGTIHLVERYFAVLDPGWDLLLTDLASGPLGLRPSAPPQRAHVENWRR